MLENPKEMNATTQPEMAIVNAQKVHLFACNNLAKYATMNCKEASKMDNQQPSLLGGNQVCRICSQLKPVSEFHIYATRGRKSRITDVCLSCHKVRLSGWRIIRESKMTPEQKAIHRERARVWRENNPDKRKAISNRSHRKRRNAYKAVVFAHYGSKCVCCGETEIGFLTIDHINNDGYVERRNGCYSNGEGFYHWVIKNNFPTHYQVLCYNCNLGRAKNGGICPHQKGSETMAKASTVKRPEAPSNPIRVDDIVPASVRKAEQLN